MINKILLTFRLCTFIKCTFDLKPSDLKFRSVAFWICLLDLHFRFQKRVLVARKLGDAIESFRDVDYDQELRDQLYATFVLRYEMDFPPSIAEILVICEGMELVDSLHYNKHIINH